MDHSVYFNHININLTYFKSIAWLLLGLKSTIYPGELLTILQWIDACYYWPFYLMECLRLSPSTFLYDLVPQLQ